MILVISEIESILLNLFEVILLSEFMNSEIWMTSTFTLFCQAGKLTGWQADRLPGFHLEKHLLFKSRQVVKAQPNLEILVGPI